MRPVCSRLHHRAVPSAGIEPASLIRFEGPAAPVHQSNDGIGAVSVLRARLELAFSCLRGRRDDRYSNGALSDAWWVFELNRAVRG